MSFGWPVAFGGLAALLVPLLIHLLQRGRYRRVEVATTRFLVEQRRLRWRTLKLSDPMLMAVRMLLIVLCVLLLAEPFRVGTDSAPATGAWTLVSPRVSSAAARDLAAAGDELRWLAAGFPLLTDPRPQWRRGELWSLLAEADTRAPPGLPLRVIAPGEAAELGPYRPALTRPVEWLPFPAGNRNSTESTQDGSDQADVAVVFDPARRADALAVANAIDAWQAIGLAATPCLVAAGAETPDARLMVWLSDRALPVDDGADRVLVTDQMPAPSGAQSRWLGPDGQLPVQEQRRGALVVRTFAAGFVADSAVLDAADFARQLRLMLADDALTDPPPAYPVAAEQRRTRVMAAGAITTAVRHPLAGSIALLIVLVGVLERLLSAMTMRPRHDA